MKTILNLNPFTTLLLFLFLAVQTSAQSMEPGNKSKRHFFLKKENKVIGKGRFFSSVNGVLTCPLAGIKRKAQARREKLSLAASTEPIPFMGSANGISVKLRF
jgi:hypothetical protein